MSKILATFISIESELKQYLLRFLLCKEDVEDVLQEAYIRASRADKKTVIRSPKSFLYKVAKNLALSEVTKKSRQIINCVDEFSKLDVVDSKSNIEEGLQEQQELDAFYQSVIEVLPPQCRRVFLMRKAFGFSHKEISRQLNISISTVEKHLIKGVKKYDDYVQGKNTVENEQNNPKILTIDSKQVKG
ncbi:MAG: RNA polymerase sigma factor [Spongiibacteraceae bacterium]